MFQKCSFSVPSDSSGVWGVKVIQTRRCSSRKHADIGKFLKVVIKSCKIFLKKRPSWFPRVKQRRKAIVIRSKKNCSKFGGVFFSFSQNSLVLLKRRINTLGKELYGPTSKNLKIKKFKAGFKFIF
jgi:ribosomal protein L14